MHFRQLRKLLRHEWIISAGLVALDLAVWMGIYALATTLRVDAFYVTPLQFFLVALLQVASIIVALFVIGGYDRQTEFRGLPYATEHILALVAAAAGSAVLVYAAATFDQSMRPSRGALS